MPKRFILIIFLTILTFGLVFSAYFYRRNLSGVWPAVNAPSHTRSVSQTSQNSTGIPLVLPLGMSISVFAQNIDGARDLEFDPSGTLLVSQPGQGRVIAIPEPGRIVNVITGLNRPHGLAFSDSTLFVAETNAVSTYSYDPKTFQAANRKKIIDLPGGGNHWTRSLLITDGRLYIAVGSTCNVCIESDWRRAKILVSNLDGTDLKVFASGLRNSVFLITNPYNLDIWATDMGRDLLGDNIPPDEINIIAEGRNYGWPICFGKNIHDASFDKNTYIRNPCLEPFEADSRIDLPAHSAPLGLAFIPDSWPADYRGKLLVAFHGSWNRTQPTGYKIVMVNPDTGSISDFISGWLKPPKDAYGRPVDLIFDSSGNLFVSDDKSGVVYKVSPLGL